MEEDQIRKYLSKLDIWKSIDLDGMYPEVPRELANVILRPLSVIFEGSR